MPWDIYVPPVKKPEIPLKPVVEDPIPETVEDPIADTSKPERKKREG